MGSATSKGARQVEAMITSVFAVRQSGLGVVDGARSRHRIAIG